MGSNLIGLVGIATILTIAVLLSSNRKAINFRIVGADSANERAAAGTDKIGLVFRYWRTCKADPAGRPSFSIVFRSLSKKARISFAACAA